MKKTRLRSVSNKRAKELRLYHRLRNKLLSGIHYCEFPDCLNHPNQIHHMNGRNGARLLDAKNWMLICSTHHTWIHDHPADARKMGLLK